MSRQRVRTRRKQYPPKEWRAVIPEPPTMTTTQLGDARGQYIWTPTYPDRRDRWEGRRPEDAKDSFARVESSWDSILVTYGPMTDTTPVQGGE